MFYQKVGGLNLTLYDSTKTGLPKKIVKNLSDFLPHDLGNSALFPLLLENSQ
jgi:hypothetical protein